MDISTSWREHLSLDTHSTYPLVAAVAHDTKMIFLNGNPSHSTLFPYYRYSYQYLAQQHHCIVNMSLSWKIGVKEGFRALTLNNLHSPITSKLSRSRRSCGSIISSCRHQQSGCDLFLVERGGGINFSHSFYRGREGKRNVRGRKNDREREEKKLQEIEKDRKTKQKEGWRERGQKTVVFLFYFFLPRKPSSLSTFFLYPWGIKAACARLRRSVCVFHIQVRGGGGAGGAGERGRQEEGRGKARDTGRMNKAVRKKQCGTYSETNSNTNLTWQTFWDVPFLTAKLWHHTTFRKKKILKKPKWYDKGGGLLPHFFSLSFFPKRYEERDRFSFLSLYPHAHTSNFQSSLTKGEKEGGRREKNERRK